MGKRGMRGEGRPTICNSFQHCCPYGMHEVWCCDLWCCMVWCGVALPMDTVALLCQVCLTKLFRRRAIDTSPKVRVVVFVIEYGYKEQQYSPRSLERSNSHENHTEYSGMKTLVVHVGFKYDAPADRIMV